MICYLTHARFLWHWELLRDVFTDLWGETYTKSLVTLIMECTATSMELEVTLMCQLESFKYNWSEHALRFGHYLNIWIVRERKHFSAWILLYIVQAEHLARNQY